MRALLVENIHPDAAARLAKEGYEVETRSRALDEDELIEALRGVSLLQNSIGGCKRGPRRIRDPCWRPRHTITNAARTFERVWRF